MWNKKISFFLLLICISLLGSSCSKDECATKDWTGKYIGRDFIKKTANGTQLVEPSITANAEISWNSDPIIGNNILLKVSLFYNSTNPTQIVLYGDANCDETFTFRNKGDYRPNLKDANNRFYTLEYSGIKGSYLNNSKDILIVINEKKTYDLEVNSTGDYLINHELKLNKQ
jgi:hypothetical protein